LRPSARAEVTVSLTSRDHLFGGKNGGRSRHYGRIIKEQLDVDEADIKPESVFIDDLGADSLGLVELVLAFEEAFEIDIPDEDTEQIRTVQDAVKYIEQHSST
jgi:acyl carrier protein